MNAKTRRTMPPSGTREQARGKLAVDLFRRPIADGTPEHDRARGVASQSLTPIDSQDAAHATPLRAGVVSSVTGSAVSATQGTKDSPLSVSDSESKDGPLRTNQHALASRGHEDTLVQRQQQQHELTKEQPVVAPAQRSVNRAWRDVSHQQPRPERHVLNSASPNALPSTPDNPVPAHADLAGSKDATAQAKQASESAMPVTRSDSATSSSGHAPNVMINTTSRFQPSVTHTVPSLRQSQDIGRVQVNSNNPTPARAFIQSNMSEPQPKANDAISLERPQDAPRQVASPPSGIAVSAQAVGPTLNGGPSGQATNANTPQHWSAVPVRHTAPIMHTSAHATAGSSRFQTQEQQPPWLSLQNAMSAQVQQALPSLRTNMRSPVTPSISGGPSTPLITQAISRIPNDELKRRVNTLHAALRDAKTLTAHDSGRIWLLLESIDRNDWSFQTLHQIFCLRSYDSTALPASIRGLSDEQFEPLIHLLSPNTSLSPQALQFMATFPEPLIDIYSDPGGARETFQFRLSRVHHVLTKLTAYWKPFVGHYSRICSPPLVQDMAETFALESLVLQRVVFTVIVREYWRRLDQSVLEQLLHIHSVDSVGYYRTVPNYHRVPQEKVEIYTMCQKLYENWQQRLADPQLAAIPFEVPLMEVAQFLKLQPASMRTTVQGGKQSSARHQGTPITSAPRAPIVSQQVAQAPQPARAGSAAMRAAVHSPSVGASSLRSHSSTPSTAVSISRQQLTPVIQQHLDLLLPPQGAGPRSQPTHPDTIRSALHQAELRSPILRSANNVQPLYRYVLGYGLPPTTLQIRPVQTIIFSISPEAFARVPQPEEQPDQLPGAPLSLAVVEGSCLYRLRCSLVPSDGIVCESAWVTAENIWPEEMQFELNGNMLEPRRKLHHGRYLPVNLTRLIKLGENVLKVYGNYETKLVQYAKTYAIAVEAVGVVAHNSITQTLTHVSLEESLEQITTSLGKKKGSTKCNTPIVQSSAELPRALNGTESAQDSLQMMNIDGDDDDELIMTSSMLSITLAEPYSNARIFDIPVRGKSCLHRDCFDLEVFLAQCPRPQPEAPSVVDCWRCPICRGDVRPQELIVDDFLVKVREELEHRGLLKGGVGDVKGIVVKEDGSWQVKKEVRNGVRSGSLGREESAATNAISNGRATPAKVIEMIELD